MELKQVAFQNVQDETQNEMRNVMQNKTKCTRDTLALTAMELKQAASCSSVGRTRSAPQAFRNLVVRCMAGPELCRRRLGMGMNKWVWAGAGVQKLGGALQQWVGVWVEAAGDCVNKCAGTGAGVQKLADALRHVWGGTAESRALAQGRTPPPD